ncbi:uncharacterized protein J3R85_001789 [Psidium guajava]|nr:uncharacterized protein J3R85_001789 [Psidium guajava]
MWVDLKSRWKRFEVANNISELKRKSGKAGNMLHGVRIVREKGVEFLEEN